MDGSELGHVDAPHPPSSDLENLRLNAHIVNDLAHSIAKVACEGLSGLIESMLRVQHEKLVCTMRSSEERVLTVLGGFQDLFQDRLAARQTISSKLVSADAEDAISGSRPASALGRRDAQSTQVIEKPRTTKNVNDRKKKSEVFQESPIVQPPEPAGEVKKMNMMDMDNLQMNMILQSQGLVTDATLERSSASRKSAARPSAFGMREAGEKPQLHRRFSLSNAITGVKSAAVASSPISRPMLKKSRTFSSDDDRAHAFNTDSRAHAFNTNSVDSTPVIPAPEPDLETSTQQRRQSFESNISKQSKQSMKSIQSTPAKSNLSKLDDARKRGGSLFNKDAFQLDAINEASRDALATPKRGTGGSGGATEANIAKMSKLKSRMRAVVVMKRQMSPRSESAPCEDDVDRITPHEPDTSIRNCQEEDVVDPPHGSPSLEILNENDPVCESSADGEHESLPGEVKFRAYTSEVTYNTDLFPTTSTVEAASYLQPAEENNSERAVSFSERGSDDSSSSDEDEDEDEYLAPLACAPSSTLQNSLRGNVRRNSMSLKMLRQQQEEILILQKQQQEDILRGSCSSCPAKSDDVRTEISFSTMYMSDADHVSEADGSPWHRLPMLVMKMAGIAPISARGGDQCYLCGVILCTSISMLLMGFLVMRGVINYYAGASMGSIAVGSILGLASLRANGVQNLVGPDATMLDRYADQNDFHADWMQRTMWRLVEASGALIIAVIALLLRFLLVPLVLNSGSCADDELRSPPLYFGIPAFLVLIHVNGLFISLVYGQIHVLTCLELMLESFCAHVCSMQRNGEEPDFPWGISEWNTLQAMLRKSSTTMESCFLSVQTSALVAFLFGSIGFRQTSRGKCHDEFVLLVIEMVPIFMMALFALTLFFKGGALSEKCTRVPSLMNSIHLPNPVDHSRQYFVIYVKNSDAGFYVRDVRLTHFMAMKITYICGGLCFGLIVDSFSKG